MKQKKLKSVGLFLLMLVAIGGVCALAWFGIGKNHRGSAKNIILGLDLKGGVSVTYEVEEKNFSSTDFEDTKAKLEKRVGNYSTESSVYAEGDNRITVDIPGVTDVEKITNDLGKPGSLYFASAMSEGEDAGDHETIKVGSTTYKIWLSGSDVKNATGVSTTDKNSGAIEYIVSLDFTDEGTKKFKEATTERLNKTIAIIYDEQVISEPTVQTIISDGSAQIDGQKDLEEAESLATTIRIGSLKLTLNQISSKVIGGKLGSDAIKTSLTAGLIGFVIVVIFMIFVYRLPGVVAGLSLILYTGAIMVCLNAFDMTLTLPGIAGIILGIGMAVDANVIIYARIREELGLGKTVKSALQIGFQKATSAIVDGNITTFIAALVLMWKGSGPVKGFAQTLAMSIVLSMFTAMIVSRALVYVLYNMGGDKPALYGVQKERNTIDFLKIKNICFIVSAVLVLGGVAGFFIKSMNYSVEFKGGISVEADYGKAYTIEEFEKEIQPKLAEVIGTNDIAGQPVSGSNQLVIKTPNLSNEKMNDMQKLLIDEFGANADTIQVNEISSSVSKEMKSNAIVSVILATICMLLYIWVRFKDIRFASSAVIALLHDVLIVLAFYVVSRTSVGNTFIACMLTIVGYSINATIVIFDRIRENVASAGRNPDYRNIVNLSITQTLTRSIYTTFTTLVMVLVLYVMGVASIREFTLPIIVGLICGVYSSVCITGALWYTMKTWKLGKTQGSTEVKLEKSSNKNKK